MTEAEKKETLARIEVVEKELVELKAKVQSDGEVPDELDDIDKPLKIENGTEVYFVDTYGKIQSTDFIDGWAYAMANNRHRLFKSEKYAEMYAEKTQFIADLLHFKWLYDRDYEPDWAHAQWTITNHDGKYVPVLSAWEQDNDMYFSTKEIAQKCADWLNRKAGII